MNKNEPSNQQLRYLRRLLHEAHSAGVPYLPIEHLTRASASAWIDYLALVARANAQVEQTPDATPNAYFVTPATSPASYRPPYVDLPEAFDHDHLVTSVAREDGIVESTCLLCGVSA